MPWTRVPFGGTDFVTCLLEITCNTHKSTHNYEPNLKSNVNPGLEDVLEDVLDDVDVLPSEKLNPPDGVLEDVLDDVPEDEDVLPNEKLNPPVPDEDVLDEVPDEDVLEDVPDEVDVLPSEKLNPPDGVLEDVLDEVPDDEEVLPSEKLNPPVPDEDVLFLSLLLDPSDDISNWKPPPDELCCCVVVDDDAAGVAAAGFGVSTGVKCQTSSISVSSDFPSTFQCSLAMASSSGFPVDVTRRGFSGSCGVGAHKLPCSLRT